MADDERMTVAVTGPTGTFGFGLLPLLEADDRIGRVVGVARRPFDPAEHGWTKLVYRRGDVRDQDLLEEAFADADVVVHLAFLVAGADGSETARAINVEGTGNAFRAAVAVGARRFVYASSASAYGFHADNPIGIDEDWPTRPAEHLFYAQEKSELEEALAKLAAEHPAIDLYLLRPPVVIGPHMIGGKSRLAERLVPPVLAAARAAGRLPVPIPVPTPDLPLQVVHEADVGSALVQCIVGAGPPGAYNIAADGILTGADIARELGLRPVTLGSGLLERTARRVAALPVADKVTGWAEAVSHPVILDTAKAKRDLGWTPRYTAIEALRETLGV
ncbi:MAG TPA: NAD-dependent epimerase/dehydratase family protein [Acidimicrobiales bacterium]|nr:NAD-dependent epimerase/dehydratase family protein [Acidimicrobiales bacterium]